MDGTLQRVFWVLVARYKATWGGGCRGLGSVWVASLCRRTRAVVCRGQEDPSSGETPSRNDGYREQTHMYVVAQHALSKALDPEMWGQVVREGFDWEYGS